jgi:putative tryptophan/tyrosine transport system substrate-binding protein
MRRRPLCALAALPFAAAVSPSRAQPARARLCVMADVMRSSPAHVGLMRGLAERGWDEGRNLDVESVQPHQDAKQSEELARRLAQRGCNVILTQGLPATLAAQAGAAQTPRVFVIASDPVALGLVATLQRPGGNATGHVTPAHEIAVKQLSLLRELAPAARRIALAFGAGSASMLLTAQSVEAAARPLGLDVRRFPLQGWQDVEAMPSALSREPVDGLLVPFDRLTYDYRAEIIVALNRWRGRWFAKIGARSREVSSAPGLENDGSAAVSSIHRPSNQELCHDTATPAHARRHEHSQPRREHATVVFAASLGVRPVLWLSA